PAREFSIAARGPSRRAGSCRRRRTPARWVGFRPLWVLLLVRACLGVRGLGSDREQPQPVAAPVAGRRAVRREQVAAGEAGCGLAEPAGGLILAVSEPHPGGLGAFPPAGAGRPIGGRGGGGPGGGPRGDPRGARPPR